jgi:hypothetical protein
MNIFIESTTLLEMYEDDLSISVALMEAKVDLLCKSSYLYITEGAKIEQFKSTIIDTCKNIKNVTGGIVNFILKVCDPLLSTIGKLTAEAEKKLRTVKCQNIYTKPFEWVCRLLGKILADIRKFTKGFLYGTGIERLESLLIFCSGPIPVPGSTEGLIVFFDMCDMLREYKKRINNNEIDQVISELEKKIADLHESSKISPDVASTGSSLLSKLKKVLTLASSQIKKLTSEISKNVKETAYTKMIDKVQKMDDKKNAKSSDDETKYMKLKSKKSKKSNDPADKVFKPQYGKALTKSAIDVKKSIYEKELAGEISILEREFLLDYLDGRCISE